MTLKSASKLGKCHPILHFPFSQLFCMFPNGFCSKYAACGEGTGNCTKTLKCSSVSEVGRVAERQEHCLWSLIGVILILALFRTSCMPLDGLLKLTVCPEFPYLPFSCIIVKINSKQKHTSSPIKVEKI